MAELRFKILGDLTKLKKDLSNLMKEKFNIGVKGAGTGGGTATPTKTDKKQSGLLLGILGKLAPLALLLSLKPIQDILSIISNSLLFMIFKIIKLIPKPISDIMQDVIDSIKDNLLSLTNPLSILSKTGDAIASKIDQSLGISELIKGWLTVAVEFIKNLPQNIWGFLKNLGAVIWDFLSKGFDLVWQGLRNVMEVLDYFLRPIINRLKNLWQLIKEKFNLLKTNLVSKLIELKNKFAQKIGLLKDKVVDKLSSVIEWLKALPERIWSFLKGLPHLIGQQFLNVFKSFFGVGRGGGGSSGGGFPGGPGQGTIPIGPSVNDAIITKRGEVIRTSPDDTIIATKNPGMGSTNIFNFNGITSDEMIQKIERVLGTNIRQSGRF